MKKEINVTGTIVFPLKEGTRAIISTSGGLTYTSLVVEIIEERPDYACFETMNSVYKVRLYPVPVQAAIPPFLKMCA